MKTQRADMLTTGDCHWLDPRRGDYALIEYTRHGDPTVRQVVCPYREQYVIAMHWLQADLSVATVLERFH